ncbi:FmdB family zinc ribbon protein [Thermodesulfobacteriota bacterium]
MPLFDFLCRDCGKFNEILISGSGDVPTCKSCGSHRLQKLISAHSSLSGPNRNRMPGTGDTACCGSAPTQADCAGPGSCCGKHPM